MGKVHGRFPFLCACTVFHFVLLALKDVYAGIPCSTGYILANVKQVHANPCATVLTDRQNRLLNPFVQCAQGNKQIVKAGRFDTRLFLRHYIITVLLLPIITCSHLYLSSSMVFPLKHGKPVSSMRHTRGTTCSW